MIIKNQDKPYWSDIKIAPYDEQENLTYDLLKDLGEENFKRCSKKIYHLDDKNKITWFSTSDISGEITFYKRCSVGSVSHELGHGVHEIYRKKYLKPNFYGEDCAEAIRYFVATKYGVDKEWLNDFCEGSKKYEKKHILERCSWNWEKFISLFKQGNLYSMHTEQELIVLNKTVELWNGFLKLAEQENVCGGDVSEVQDAIHKIQGKIAVICMRRVEPGVWSKKNS